MNELEGCEVNSLVGEGVLYFDSGKIYREGEEVTFSKQELNEIYDEYVEQEVGGDLEDLL